MEDERLISEAEAQALHAKLTDDPERLKRAVVVLAAAIRMAQTGIMELCEIDGVLPHARAHAPEKAVNILKNIQHSQSALEGAATHAFSDTGEMLLLPPAEKGTPRYDADGSLVELGLFTVDTVLEFTKAHFRDSPDAV